MNFKRFFTILSIVIFSGSLAWTQASARERLGVSQDWLTETYSNKTWPWENGHAYFAPDGTFEAVVGRSQSAEGEWYTASGGKVCFRAIWKSGASKNPAKKCWKHATDGKSLIWQAPLEGALRPRWSRFDPDEELIPGNVYKYRFEYATGRRESIDANPMDAVKLARMYAGKTWKWEDGHAYFGDGGALTAVAGDTSIGEGKWFATRKGNLCIDATWTGTDYDSVRTKRCWLHAEDAGGTIWQSPTDDIWGWGVFDPRRDLARGNIYASRFARQKQRIAR